MAKVEAVKVELNTGCLCLHHSGECDTSERRFSTVVGKLEKDGIINPEVLETHRPILESFVGWVSPHAIVREIKDRGEVVASITLCPFSRWLTKPRCSILDELKKSDCGYLVSFQQHLFSLLKR